MEVIKVIQENIWKEEKKTPIYKSNGHQVLSTATKNVVES